MTSPRIQILALPSVFDSAFHIVRDSLETALREQASLREAPAARLDVVTMDGRSVVSGSRQRIRPDRSAQRARPDYVVVPGFRAGDDAEAVRAYVAHARVAPAVRWLASQHERGASLAAGCTAVWLLAEAGVLKDQVATTTWYHAAAFRSRYPDVRLDTRNMMTHANRVRCAGAAMAHMDLVLGVIGDAMGPDVSRRVAATLLLDERPSQSHFMITEFLSEGSEELRRLASWIKANLDQPIEVEDMAAYLHVSKRSLARRVKEATSHSPLQFLQRMRVEEAVRLLKTTPLSVAQVSARVGYRDRATLRRLLKRLTNQTPAELRRAPPA